MKKLNLSLVFMVLVLFACSTTNDDPGELSEFATTNKIEIEIQIDGVSFRLDYANSPDPEFNNDAILYVEFTSIAGTSYFSEQDETFFTEFDNPEVLGKLIRGDMGIDFSGENGCLYVVDQTRTFESFIFGNVVQTFEFGHMLVPYSQTYFDDFSEKTVVEFALEGAEVCNAESHIDYNEVNDVYTETITNIDCGEGSYVKVRVFLDE